MEKVFEKRAGWVFWGILIISAIVMFVLAQSDSLTMDELAHIPAGYGYVRYLDFRLNPEHPPLLKALSGMSLLFLKANFPIENTKWTNDINAQWDLGRIFIFESGNNSPLLIFLARIGPMLLALLLLWFVYRWSRELMGGKWALLPAILMGLYPNFLSHGPYVTTDVAAAFGTVFATYFFLRFLNNPSGKNVFVAGLAFGIAQLCKFSAVLLLPYFAILLTIRALILVYGRAGNTSSRKLFSVFFYYSTRAVLIFAIAFLLLIYPVYGLFTWNYPLEKQSADAEFILQSFGNGPTPAGKICKPARCLADATIWMSGNHITRPLAEYALGVLMVVQRSAGGNNNYFMGNVSAAGSHLYFPLVYLMKEALPVLLMILGAIAFSIWRMINVRAELPLAMGFREKIFIWLENNFTETALLIFVALYWAYSIQSPLNIGFRHLLPTLPFMYMLLACSWQRHHLTHPAVKTSGYILAILIVWFGLEGIYTYPHYLSYFNQAAGGINNGYRYVTDSNYDWGQDLLRLKKLLDGHPEMDRFAIDYFGGSHVSYYFGDKSVNWWSSRGDPRKEGINWLVVAANSLQGSIQRAAPGFARKPEDEYRWLTDMRPRTDSDLGAIPKWDLRAGTSLFIYHLP
ncbi:MAG: glycosyltransferase family 39 protein [Candidatus Liptonbacteria bacterium]